MTNGFPTGEVIQELLAQAARNLLDRTGERFQLALDTDTAILTAIRKKDGFHCAFEVRKGPVFTRTEGEAIGGLDLSGEWRARTELEHRLAAIVRVITRTHKAEVAGVAFNEAWRNDPGEPYATLPVFGVTVHRFDTVDSLMSHHWSFYIGDRRIFSASPNLLGDAPSVEVLTAVWTAYQDGMTAGEQIGFKDGRKALKRDLRDLLAVETDPDFSAGIISRDEAVQALGQDWRKIAASIDAICVGKDGSLTSVPAEA